MSPTPPRQPGWYCGCGYWNESFRTTCGGCLKPKASIDLPLRLVFIDDEPAFLSGELVPAGGDAR